MVEGPELQTKTERLSFLHYLMILIYLVILEIQSLRSLSRCLTDELDIPISFKHLQRITKDMGIRCKRSKLELLHGSDYQEGRKRVEDYKRVASALKKRSDVSI